VWLKMKYIYSVAKLLFVRVFYYDSDVFPWKPILRHQKCCLVKFVNNAK
jgi:hypothetical protein